MASNFLGGGIADTCTRWDKKKSVYVEINRPEVIQAYNSNMGGVDKLDFLLTVYKSFIRSNKWTLRMFTHSFDLACVNSWFEYKKDAMDLGIHQKNIMDLIHFRTQIAEALILCNRPQKRARGRPLSFTPPNSKQNKKKQNIPIDDVRYDGLNHLPVFEDKAQSRCKFCYVQCIRSIFINLTINV